MFEGIPEFIAVAETHGFTAAAKRLGVSTSHVSRRVADLESRIGSALVARSTRKVKLTNEGQIYYERCVDLVNGLEEANELITAGQIELSGVLRVSAAGEFAETFIAPALIEFIRQHPRLTIEMDISPRMVNFVEEGFDFAIRYAHSFSDSGLVARKLVNHTLIAAASPSYLEKFGTPQTPQQLNNHNCLVTNNPQWRFQYQAESIDVAVGGSWRANSVRSILYGCEAGLGIAYMPSTSFGNSITSGKLKTILEPYWNTSATSWIVYANRKYLPVRVRMAMDFLFNRFQS